MVIRTKKIKYYVSVLLIICLMVACMAPAVHAIAGIDDAVIGVVVASCAMYGVQWAIGQGAQALSRADIVETVRSKLRTSGFTDADMQMIANGIRHPAQGIFSLSAEAFRKITGLASDLKDEVDASPSGEIKVGNSSDYVQIGDFKVPTNGSGLHGGVAIEDACNLGVWDPTIEETKLNAVGDGFASCIRANGAWQLEYVKNFIPQDDIVTLSASDILSNSNPRTYYLDLRPVHYIENRLAWYISTRANWNMDAWGTSAYQSPFNTNGQEVMTDTGKSVYVRGSVADKPLPDLELLPDTGEINISTGLDFTDTDGLVDSMVNVVNGTGSYIPVYDYSQDIDELTTSSNGILGNTTGILSGVGRLENIGQGIKELLQSIVGTLAQVLEAVISLAQTAFDFLTSLPAYLASFAGKFAGIWHYVVSWVGSLGSWLSVMFTVWSGLPYAMVVPVYASAVIVLVVFVFKRFFG